MRAAVSCTESLPFNLPSTASPSKPMGAPDRLVVPPASRAAQGGLVCLLSSRVLSFSLCLLLVAVPACCLEAPVHAEDCRGEGCGAAAVRGSSEPGAGVPSPESDSSRKDDDDGSEGAPQQVRAPPTHSIFMLPGIAGSGLMVSATDAALPKCAAHPVSYPVPFRLWASLALVRPPRSHQLCWLDLMQPLVDGSGDAYSNKQGLKVEKLLLYVRCLPLQVDRYGTAHAFDYLDYYYNDRFGVPGTAYFHRMLHTFYSLGYDEGGSLIGVPYDWRLPPWQVDFARLKKDIEESVASTGGSKVDVLVHSLGSIVCNYFFNKVVDQQWKDKHINSYTLVAPATGGSFKAIKALLTGYNDPVDLTFWSFLDVSLIPVDVLRDLSRSMGSIYALLPDIDLYGKDHVVLKQILVKSEQPSSLRPSAAAAAAEETAGEAARAERGLEMRRLQEEKEEGGLSWPADGPQQAVEETAAAHSQDRLRERAEQVRRYAQREAKEMAELEKLAAAQGAEEVIYTLGNWTTLLEPELRARALAAQERMQGILKDPGVPTRCIWSTFAAPSTDISYIYRGTDLSVKPISVLDVGDDTVPLRSLSVCTGWASTFEVKTFKNLDHMFIFGDGGFNDYIQLAFGQQQKSAAD